MGRIYKRKNIFRSNVTRMEGPTENEGTVLNKLGWILTLVVVFSTLWSEASENSSQSQDAMMEITGARMEAHVRFLADDLLEGRGTATRGYDLAALYVRTEFEELGLKPGANGSYYQEVPFRKADLVTEKCSLTLIRNGKQEILKMSEVYTMPSFYNASEAEVTAGVIFVGFGVTAPDQNYDDYAKVDVHGKVVAFFTGAPTFFPVSTRAHYSSTYAKQKNAAEHGAVGILVLRTPRDEENYPWEKSVRQSTLSGFRWLESDGSPHDIFASLQGGATLNRAGIEKLFEGSSPDLAQVLDLWKNDKLESFALPVQVQMKTVTQHEKTESPNVIGLMEGSDPQLKNEYVVYSAHLDHIGITAPVNGDSINNGAYDNATGIAALIETARAFLSLPKRPKRSILFLAVTGEEKGLQGSDYFANNPTVPNGSIVANINTDMFLMLYPFTNAVVLGAENSSLGPIAAQALKVVGLTMTPDPAPDEVRFVRSDQYPFIKKGIPAVNLDSGFQSSDPAINCEEVTRDWLRRIYHAPGDDTTQNMHWESGEKLVRASFLIGLAVANNAERPQWNKGDFFGITFGKMKPQSH